MKLFRGLHNLPAQSAGSVVTIGNFDGVHRGHQAVIAALCETARGMQLPATLICFEPTPQEFFAADAPPARLTRWAEKLTQLKQTGLDQMLLLRFDAKFARLSAEQFVRQILLDGLAAKHVLVGADFRYGHKRAGTLASLQAAGEQLGFGTASAPTYSVNGERVSSSRVRAALTEGNLSLAAQLLGRDYSVSGRVIHGDKRGRQWGYPTANIALCRQTSPVNGIFVVRISGAATQPVYGVASIGTRPSVGGKRLLLEVHLFDFDAALYGRRLEVALLHKLRDESHFDNITALRAAIERDELAARQWLNGAF